MESEYMTGMISVPYKFVPDGKLKIIYGTGML